MSSAPNQQKENVSSLATKASARFIFATIFLDALGIGLLIPVFPDVIRRFGQSPEFVNHYFGYFISVYALMQFVASPILGSLSDKFGRRPILLVSLLVAGFDYILMAFAPNLFWLFAGRVAAGLTGASITAASSYMADVSDDKNRSANFGLIGAAFGLGFIVGPSIGGLLGRYGFQAPFVCAAILNILNFIFGFFILPESLPAAQRRKIEIAKLNPLRSLSKIIDTSTISLFIWIYFLINLAGQVHPSIWTLYTQYKFGWKAFEVGLSLTGVGVFMAIGQGYLTRILIPKMGERKALQFGIWCQILAMAGCALAQKGWVFYATLPIFAFSGLAGPALQSLISKRTPSNEQGELQGSLISLSSLTAIIGPLFYTSLFSYFTSAAAPFIFPGIAYWAATAICLVAIFIFILRKNSIVKENASAHHISRA